MIMIKFPSIDQFRTTVSNVKHISTYIGRDSRRVHHITAMVFIARWP